MGIPQPKADTSVQIQRIFDAPRERVFRAWTEPEELKKWWGPAGFSTPSAEIDLRVGGRYRLVMRSPDGGLSYLVGAYREVLPPERLVYTWSWEEGSAGDCANAITDETLVTVEFHERGNSTEVLLTHDYLPDERAREGHTEGWSGSLDRLAELL
jgi:uncharacterized protein YndB with AHSA1/START domain